MSFPLSIKYSTPLKSKITPDDFPVILNHINNFIVNEPTENITIENNKLSFKPGFVAVNWRIMRAIDKATFELVKEHRHITLVYEFFLYKFFIFTSIIALFVGFASQTAWLGIVTLLSICGINWIITLLRHKAMFDDLVIEINSMSHPEKL